LKGFSQGCLVVDCVENQTKRQAGNLNARFAELAFGKLDGLLQSGRGRIWLV